MEQKLVFITGASRGIGHAIFKVFAESGEYIVVGSATSAEGAVRLTDMCAQLGIQGGGYILDVKDRAAISQLSASLKDQYGLVPSILINNAGITQDNLTLRMSELEWQSVIDTNLSSVFYLSQQVLKGMLKQRWGRIINIGSVIGSTGNPGQINYAAAKAGLLGVSRSLAQEVASRNVTVNVVSPGFIETDMTQRLSEGHKTAILNRVPLGRMGHVDEIAGLVRFLASDAAAYMTGCNIHINGGMFME